MTAHQFIIFLWGSFSQFVRRFLCWVPQPSRKIIFLQKLEKRNTSHIRNLNFYASWRERNGSDIYKNDNVLFRRNFMYTPKKNSKLHIPLKKGDNQGGLDSMYDFDRSTRFFVRSTCNLLSMVWILYFFSQQFYITFGNYKWSNTLNDVECSDNNIYLNMQKSVVFLKYGLGVKSPNTFQKSVVLCRTTQTAYISDQESWEKRWANDS